MKKYLITNNCGVNYHLQFSNLTEARHWVINHLDLSENWSVIPE